MLIIAKAREFDAKDVVTDPDVASNPTDDNMVAVLEDHRDDPVVHELVAVIHDMSEDQQVNLVALTWLGRGDGGIGDWSALRDEAARAHNRRTASYLLGIPLLADYLGEAAAQFGISCDSSGIRLRLKSTVRHGYATIARLRAKLQYDSIFQKVSVDGECRSYRGL